jgi:putative mafB-like protein
MADELEYVVHGALMVCDKGTAPGFFTPTYNAKTKVSGCLVTTAMDKLPITNIPSFTVCSISQKPCIPVPTEWENTYKVKVQGQDTLLARSCMKCGLGGKIEFVTSGQVPLPQDALDDIKAMQEAGVEPEEDDGLSWWDAAELIPVIGSGIGIVREAKKGHWWMAAANVGFLISDIAGVVSFGATTAASTAGKTALKGGTKIAAKSATKAAAKKVGKTGLKTALKLTAKGAKEKFVTKVGEIVAKASKGKICVLACFPAGTKVHTATGIRNIEDIQVGDSVWSFNEMTGEYGLQKVLRVMSRESDHSIQLYVNREMIETTALHPFYTSDGWKDAGDLVAGDYIKTQTGELVEINKVVYQYNAKKVFNFEVANWHTYFVGALAWLVHNARPCLDKIKNLPEWLQHIQKGNYFNFIREQTYKRLGGFNEVVLSTGKRLDSYIPNKEIVSRKFTQLGEDGVKHIDELAKKYKPGTSIKNTPRNAEVIGQGGDALKGQMILEVPPQKAAIPEKVLDRANKKDVLIRDTNGKIYNK